VRNLLLLASDPPWPYERTRYGLLTDLLPRVAPYLLWAGKALATFVGIGNFLFMRSEDFASKAIIGILVRTLCGVAVGLPEVLLL
jgi:hypothetical protein